MSQNLILKLLTILNRVILSFKRISVVKVGKPTLELTGFKVNAFMHSVLYYDHIDIVIIVL